MAASALSPAKCDYGKVGTPLAIATNSFLNIFGMGSLVDPVGCVSGQIAQVQAQQRAFLDESTFQMFETQLVIMKQQLSISGAFAELNNTISEYYYEILNGKYNTLSISIPMLTILIFLILVYILTLPLPSGV